MSMNRQLHMDRVIRRYAMTGGVIIERFSGGAWADGRWVNEQPVTAALTGHIQPMGGKQKQTLPEGDRTKNAISLWSVSEVRPVQRADGKPGDIVLWLGGSYECVAVTDWSHQGNFWQADCVGVDQ